MDIISLCKQIEDPRMDRRKVHDMATIIYIAVAAVICGAQSWNEIEEFGKAKFDFFQKRLPGLSSIPSHDTFNRFFSIIKPAYFELVFRNWVKEVCGKISGVVAIDGKLMRGPSKCDQEHTTGREGFKLWIVSAWAAENGVSLGQVKVDDKSNEITAVPLLIKALDLEDCIITIDAMGCQKKITREIIERKSNYIIAIKDNQKTILKDVKKALDTYKGYTRKGIATVGRYNTENTGHGRVEKRRCTVLSMGDLTKGIFGDKFEGLQSVISMESERVISVTGECSVETRYFISSLDASDPERIALAIRQHWGIENNLHWQLDVTFGEDCSRKIKNAAQNFSVVTKMTLSMLKNNKTKGSINLKRLKAGWDENFLETLLQENNF